MTRSSPYAQRPGQNWSNSHGE